MKTCLTQCLVAAALITFPSCGVEQSGQEAVSLFDGKNLDAWQTPKGEAPNEAWKIEEDGSLFRQDGAGNIVTKQEFTDFDLSWEWKIAEGSNSGVKYWVTDIKGQPLGLEFQIIDDEKHIDAIKNGPTHQSAALYDIKAPSESKPLKVVGEWNQSRIVAKGGVLQHWLNGEKVMEIDTATEEWKTGMAESKYAKYEGFAPGRGRILLQDHKDPVWFRNIQIVDLSK